MLVTDEQEGPREVDASTNQSLVPSSFGFTFCVDSGVEKVELIYRPAAAHRPRTAGFPANPRRPAISATRDVQKHTQAAAPDGL